MLKTEEVVHGLAVRASREPLVVRSVHHYRTIDWPPRRTSHSLILHHSFLSCDTAQHHYPAILVTVFLYLSLSLSLSSLSLSLFSLDLSRRSPTSASSTVSMSRNAPLMPCARCSATRSARGCSNHMCAHCCRYTGACDLGAHAIRRPQQDQPQPGGAAGRSPARWWPTRTSRRSARRRRRRTSAPGCSSLGTSYTSTADRLPDSDPGADAGVRTDHSGPAISGSASGSAGSGAASTGRRAVPISAPTACVLSSYRPARRTATARCSGRVGSSSAGIRPTPHRSAIHTYTTTTIRATAHRPSAGPALCPTSSAA